MNGGGTHEDVHSGGAFHNKVPAKSGARVRTASQTHRHGVCDVSAKTGHTTDGVCDMPAKAGRRAGGVCDVFVKAGRTAGIRAFTLVEVLLALGLFVVATGILSGSLYSGLKAYRAATNDTLIENRYRLALRQVLAVNERTEFERGGTLRLPDGTRAQWEAQLERDSVLLDLFTAQITLRLEGDLPGQRDRRAEHERRFDLQVYRTNWADVTERAQLLEDRRRALEERREGR